jgi:DnaJ-class molecular chaperone
MVLGGDATVILPSGKSVTLTLAPFSQTGQRLRIKGEGLPPLKPNDSERGHVYVKLMPQLPAEGDAEAAAYQNAMRMLDATTAFKR